MTIRRTTIAFALGLGLLTIGFACDESEQTNSGTSPATALSTGSMAPPMALSPALPATIGDHKLSVRTSPGAQCWLHAQGSPAAAQSKPYHADGNGLIRFYLDSVSEQATDRGSFLQLDCTAQNGAVLPPQLVDPIAAASFEQSVAAEIEASATLRPALTGDPNAPSQTALLKNGYPIRPDPSDHVHYQRWLKAVSIPLRMLPSATVPIPGVKETANQTGSNASWAGPVVTNPGTQYLSVSGEFTVPAIKTPGVLENMPQEIFSFWTGLDGFSGDGSKDVCQAGMESDVSNAGLGVYTWFDFAWIDWAGQGNQFENGLSLAVNTGNNIIVTVWVGNADQSNNVNGFYCWAFVYNTTIGQAQTVSYQHPADANYFGTSAEWIVERPLLCQWFFGWSCGFEGLAHFANTQMTNTVAHDVHFNLHTPMTDSGSILSMYSGAPNRTGILVGSTLSTRGGASGDGDPIYVWKAPY
jgi:peptidase A4-like protein